MNSQQPMTVAAFWELKLSQTEANWVTQHWALELQGYVDLETKLGS